MITNNSLRVGVSGVGGGRGQSIMKCLFQSKLAVEVYPADVTPFAAGLYRSRHVGVILPKPEESIDEWLRWAEENKLQALFPGSDHDLLPFSEHHADFLSVGCFTIVSRPEAVRISNDKLKTIDALCMAGLDFPRPITGATGRDKPIHAIIKPLYGMASRGLHEVNSWEEFDWYFRKDTLAQEYLDGDEYTASLFFDKFGFVSGCFVLRRELWGGTTWKAESRDFPAIREYLIEEWGPKMGRYGFVGPVNIQLKDVPGRGPVTFEINAGCSGSTAIRAHWGYNEPEKSLRHFVLLERSLMNSLQQTGYVLRYVDEVFLDGVSAQQIAQQSGELKGKVPSWL